jgi:hypothetical protein
VSPRLRRWLLMGLAVLAGLNALVFLSYTLRRVHGERRLAERRKQVEQELQQELAVAAHRRRQVETIRLNTADVQRFYGDTVGGRAAALVPVLSAIEGFAREGGMRPGAASYRAADVKGLPLDQFEITMPVEGSYRQLVALVQRLERSQYFLTLDEVRLSRDSRGQGAELALMLSCYFKKGAAAP